MKRFISSFVLILVIIGLIIGLVYTGKCIVNKNAEIARLNQEVSNLQGQVTTLNDTIEKLQDKTNTDNTPVIEPKEEEKEKTKAVFDSSKITNLEDQMTVTQDISDSMDIISINVDVESNALNININKELAKLIYGYTGDGQTHTVAGFSQKIMDAKIAMVGTTSKDLKVVLLMEDGSIKYIEISSILDGSYTVQTIADEKDYTSIAKVVIKTQDNTRYGIVGIKEDGTNKIIKFN